MTITVVGGGAIGGVAGAALVCAGHDVFLVGRVEDHVAAMNAHGLTPDALDVGLDLVLLAVKSQDTAPALEAITPRLPRTAPSCRYRTASTKT